MRTILLGGTGFIGRELTRAILRKGWQAVVPSRSPQKYEGLFDQFGKAELVAWDAKDPDRLAAIISGGDVVVNLLGASIADSRWTPEVKERIRSSRVEAGQALVQAFQKVQTPPSILVQGSAIGYYGNRGNEILTESDSPPPVGMSFLADVAREWEASTLDIEAMGVRRIIVRTGIVLGTEGGVLDKFLTPFQLFLGGPIGSGKQWMSWIHRTDEVQAMLFCVENESCRGAFNFTAPAPVRNKEFGEKLGRALNRPSWLPAPGFALKLAMGEMAEELVLGGQRVLPRELENKGYAFAFPELSTALQDIIQRMQ